VEFHAISRQRGYGLFHALLPMTLQVNYSYFSLSRVQYRYGGFVS
jgi:hypothetical protein